MNKDDFLNNNLVNDGEITVEPTNLDAQSVLQILIKFQDFINSKVVHDGKDGLDALVYTGIMRRTTTNELAVGDTFSLPANHDVFSREPNVGDTFILLATTQVSGGSPSSGNQTLYLYLCEVTEKIDNTVTCSVYNRRPMGGSTLIYNGVYTADSMPTSISVSRETLSRLPFPDEFCLIIATINGTNYLLIGECQGWHLSQPTPETITLTIQQSVAIPNGQSQLYLHNVSIRTTSDNSIVLNIQYFTKTNIAFTNLTDFINNVYLVYGQNNLNFPCVGRYIYNNKSYNVTAINILSNSLKLQFTMPDVPDQSTYYQTAQVTSDVNVVDVVVNS